MYCTCCGTELDSHHRFCHQCGNAYGSAAAGLAPRRLSRPRVDHKWGLVRSATSGVAGVCSGIARYLGVDVALIRILFICLALWPPCVGVIFYIVCWIVMPRDPLALPPAASTSLATTPTGVPAVS
jgi:phage shock protein C